MNGIFLEKILAAKRERVQKLKAEVDETELAERVVKLRRDAQANRLTAAMNQAGRTNIIAEIKRSSPSKGVINAGIDVAELSRKFRDGGAAAISVLTEEDFFGGSLGDLCKVSEAVELPILRKDFIVDEFQIYESAVARADAILLIVAALDVDELETFQKIARDLKMDVVVEVHNREEMEIAASVGARIIGVNNRDLRTFEVSLDVSRELRGVAPAGALLIAESGIKTRAEILELVQLGYSGFLIGETFMRSVDPELAVRELAGAKS
ncbi:MAG: indole-3-glycerol phosphate synthase TrpC [Blastocatellia bacterium]|nr:indole-3-glycerol phosphate synthase TrpC [Blastocatellia bacterium]